MLQSKADESQLIVEVLSDGGTVLPEGFMAMIQLYSVSPSWRISVAKFDVQSEDGITIEHEYCGGSGAADFVRVSVSTPIVTSLLYWPPRSSP